MDKFVIEGGFPLRGEIQVSGAKNAALPLMTAALLGDGPTTLENVPRLRDVLSMKDLLEHLGAKVEYDGGTMRIDPSGFDVHFVPHEIMSKMRASMYAMGPMIARFGRASISLPGGCAIGARPVDLHLRGFEALGCNLILRHGYVHAAHRSLRGATIGVAGANGPSVGATCNLMMAAAFAEGETVLFGAACEPDVVALGEMLREMGADIDGLGTRRIRVRGRKSLRGVRVRVIPDRIEAATHLIAGAMTGGDLIVRGARQKHMTVVVDAVRAAGAEVEVIDDDTMHVRRTEPLRRAPDVRTSVFPGFPTDVQSPWMALATICPGESVIDETIYQERFMHVPELIRMGADLVQQGGRVYVRGVERLYGAPVMASDLRCGAALVLAALAAEGTSEVLRVYHIERGYEDMDKKLAAAGARVTRSRQEEASDRDAPPEFPPELGFYPPSPQA